MSQQTYPVACACGKVHNCPPGYAGTTFACGCGKAVEVPSLTQLRAAKGQRVLSPEVEIQTLVAGNVLPEESDCCLCGCQTTDTLMLHAVCEKRDSQSSDWGDGAKSGCLIPFLGLWGWLAVSKALQNTASPEGSGRQVEVRFPLRMCQSCASEVSSWDVIRTAMKRTQVYRRLLLKYPECQLSTMKKL